MSEPLPIFASLKILEQLIEYIKNLINSKESHVITFTWENQDCYGISLVPENVKLTIINLETYELYEQFKDAILPESTKKDIAELNSLNCPMNSRVAKSVIFPTKLPGLYLQIINWAESSNFAGGYDIGGKDPAWLVNHSPVPTVI